MNVLVLGVTGMLGSMVFSYFKANTNHQVFGTYRHRQNLPQSLEFNEIIFFDASNNINKQLDEITKKVKPDYIINCIGIINKYCNSDDSVARIVAVQVNSIFPAKLLQYYMKNGNVKILQIATDCVYDGKKKHGYLETDLHNATDVYGKSKSLGEIVSQSIINIRCSIIGPELNNFGSLFEWFISNGENEVVDGYTNHIWNGVTTLQFAQFCEKIIAENLFESLRQANSVIHYVPNAETTKYELLQTINEIFNRKVKINAVCSGDGGINRKLDTLFFPKVPLNDIADSIGELKMYLLQNDVFITERYFS
jgi:dTDP-4-dehydrorhamnose reductase